jgi:sugar transferase (PEP-CTERM/EpsH1 system associated)
MHLLFVTYSLPYPPDGGAKARDFQFLRHLASRHRVTCVCLMPPTDETAGVETLRQLGLTVHLFPQRTGVLARAAAAARALTAGRPIACADYFDPGMFAALRRIAATDPADAVQIEHSFLAPYLEALPAPLRSRSLLDLHNIGATQYASLADLPRPPLPRLIARIKAALMRDWEAAAARRFAAVAVVSRLDAEWLRARTTGVPIHLLPNGADTHHTSFRPQRAASRRLLFVGTMGYAPNADAACWFCDELLPRLRQTFPAIAVDIVGRGPTPEVRALARHHGVRVTGGVSDLAPFYEEAAVVIVPLRAGGGTRLKILEAMAWGRAVVSTHAGCEGLDVIDGEHLLIADEPDRFAAHIAALFDDVPAREALAARARAFVETHHDWDTICARLSSHLEGMITGTAGADATRAGTARDESASVRV